MKKIYIIEDDDNIRDMVTYALSSAGFAVEGFSGGKEFWQFIGEEKPALILLDIMLPGEDGISILNKLKKSDELIQIPVIMLTAKGSEYDRIKGLDLGADDYVTKPFSVLEIISRIKAVLRRSAVNEEKPNRLIVGDIILNNDKHTVYVNDKEITLTYKEFELLHYLMINEGIVLSRNKILENVWGFDYNGESRTVDMHIKTLRQKLLNGGENIKTIRNVGYKIGG